MGEYGTQLNWEDSYGPAAKHLGVSEDQWQAFIAGVNDTKTRAQAWSDQGGNQARVMQDRSTPGAMRDRRVEVLLYQNPDMTPEEAMAQVEASSAYQDLSSNIQGYEALNAELNDLYSSVGLDPTGALQGSGTSAPGYAVNFDFNSGDVSHSKGDVAHSVGKAIVSGIGAGMLGTGVAGALNLTGALGGAVKGAVGSAASQGMLTGKIDAGDVLRSGLAGGAVAAFSDYLADSANMFPDSDLGGLTGDGGLLNKMGVDTDYVSTSAGIKALNAAANNPIVDGAQKLLSPLLSSELGQKGLDALTSAVMDGYNNEWEKHYDPKTGGLGAGASAEDFRNFNRFNSAIYAGENALAAGNSLDGSPIWRLDERYPWTNTPRDPNSTLVGILDTPLETGGQVDQPAFVINPPKTTEIEEDPEDGKAGSGTGTEDGDGNADDLNDSKDDGENSSGLGEIVSGGFAQDNTIKGNQSGSGSGIIDDTVLPPSSDASQILINQLIEAINLETDIGVKAGLEDELTNYLQGTSGDQTLPGGVEDVGTSGFMPVPVVTGGSDVVLPPKSSDQDLPPSDSTGGGGGGIAPGPTTKTNSNGLPVLWSDLFGYTKFNNYSSKRQKLYNEMMGKLASSGKQGLLSRIESPFLTPREQELFEAGEFKR